MAFNLPPAFSLHEDSADDNVGSIGTNLVLRAKSGGNLPITNGASRIQYSDTLDGPAEGVFFGFDNQNTLGLVDTTTNAKILIWSLQFNAPNRIQVATHGLGGIRFWLGSGDSPKNNYREFFIGGNDTPFAASQAGPITICIDLGDSSYQNTVGTFVPTNVTAYGIAAKHSSLAGSQYGEIHTQRAFLLDVKKISATLPYFSDTSNFDSAVTAVQGTDYTNKIGSWITKSGTSFFVPCPFAFGNGTDPCSFNDSGVTVVSPASNATNQENFRLTNTAMSVYLNTRNNAADSVSLSGSYVWGTPAPWDFSQNYPAVVANLSGSFSGMGDFTMGSSVNASGTFTVADGYLVISSGATLDNATFNSGLNISTTGVTDYSGLTVNGNIDFAAAGSYSFTDSSMSSISNTSGGNITVQLSNTTIQYASIDPSITVVSAPRTLTLTGLQQNSEVRIFEAGTTIPVDGIEESEETFTAFAVNVNSVDVVVHSIAYEYLRVAGVNTTNNVELPIQQRFDRSYQNG